jgi:hypothetical protein
MEDKNRLTRHGLGIEWLCNCAKNANGLAGWLSTSPSIRMHPDRHSLRCIKKK